MMGLEGGGGLLALCSAVEYQPPSRRLPPSQTLQHSSMTLDNLPQA